MESVANMYITPQEIVLLCKLIYKIKAITSCFYQIKNYCSYPKLQHTQLPRVNLIYHRTRNQ